LVGWKLLFFSIQILEDQEVMWISTTQMHATISHGNQPWQWKIQSCIKKSSTIQMADFPLPFVTTQI